MRVLLRLFIFVSIASLGFFTVNTIAAQRTWACSVYEVQYDGYGRLRIICDGIDYWAQKGGKCPNVQPYETLKQWQALATSALLSGFKLDLYWDNSGSCGRRLVTVGLVKD